MLPFLIFFATVGSFHHLPYGASSGATLIENSNDSTGVALDIKNFLLRVIDDDKNDAEKFSDEQLAEAERIINRAGSSAFYWMTDIAAQMTMLATAQLNGFPTNVSQELGDSATPEQVIDTVVKI